MANPPSAGDPVNVGPFQRIVDFYWPDPSTGSSVIERFKAIQATHSISDNTVSVFVGDPKTLVTEFELVNNEYFGSFNYAFVDVNVGPTPSEVTLDPGTGWRLIDDPEYAAWGISHVTYSGLTSTVKTWRYNESTGVAEPFQDAVFSWAGTQYGPFEAINWRQLDLALQPSPLLQAWYLQVSPSIFE